MSDLSKPISRGRFIKTAALLGTSVLIGGQELRLISSTEAAVTPPSITNCNGWGAQAARQAVTMLSSKPTKILVHHTTNSNTTNYTQAQAFSLARQIQQSHFSRGWLDTGQQFTISRGGYVMEGRHRSLEALQGGTQHLLGAHCDGQNSYAVGIENEGTYTSVQPPQAQYNQLVGLCAYICSQYGIASSQIFGHRDFNSTECPGDQLYAMLPQIRADVATRLGTGGGGTTRIWPLVSVGNNGEVVKTVQYLLKNKGYSLTVDGAFGTGTQNTVKSFQTSQGLSSDGVVGAGTWEVLIVTTRLGDNNSAVSAVQSQLKSKGYSLTVDGDFGTGTQNAVKSFQTSKGLGSDGVVGANTWNALVK